MRMTTCTLCYCQHCTTSSLTMVAAMMQPAVHGETLHWYLNVSPRCSPSSIPTLTAPPPSLLHSTHSGPHINTDIR